MTAESFIYSDFDCSIVDVILRVGFRAWLVDPSASQHVHVAARERRHIFVAIACRSRAHIHIVIVHILNRILIHIIDSS